MLTLKYKQIYERNIMSWKYNIFVFLNIVLKCSTLLLNMKCNTYTMYEWIIK